MKLLEPNPDIEEEKDLTLFIQKYLQAFNPGTIGKYGHICRDGMRRSFSDIRELYLNYNPEAIVSYDDMIRCLLDVKFDNDYTLIRFRYCSTPCKVVIFASNSSPAYFDWKQVVSNIYYWNESKYYNVVGVDGLTDKYVIELLKTEFNNKNK